MTEPRLFICLLVAAYAAGSVNFAILLFRLTGREDPRRHGSGNPGATNVYRQAGVAWALAVLLLDMARAVAVCLAAQVWLPPGLVPWVGLGLILGNRFPCFHGFKGGKGVANYLGFTAPLAPVWSGVGMLAWGTVYLIGRTPFLASFAMVACLAAGTLGVDGMDGGGGLGVMATALFIGACHHTNIRQWRRRR